ncbi:hypothetical protein JOQ06_000101 [Pogonophryne albipinna]|uniref:Uncharacterized protein n=1 Tax=Pogonophryne albipinna TaxID=1090488 RepID=A0AAD6A553_9TELE|nr:hypothetical protein JOQ06_000101 [Pogonophryne albipinna]
MATGRRQMKKKHPEDKLDNKVFDFTEVEEKKGLSGSEDDAKEEETPVVDKLAKKRPAEDFEEGATTAVG